MIGGRLLDSFVRSQTQDTRRFGRSVRQHTLDLVRHPVRTAVQTAVMTGLFLFLFVLVTNPEGMATLAAGGPIGVGDVLAVLPNPFVLAALVVGLVVLVLAATVSADVSNDMRYR
ncbi:hypothetical protein [Halogranum rubrum]|uniref:Uncharacterized protein n=1 Tax=Halogranum salarium B-1 TaxID=1210908 RepID=J2ZE20_9EURY|nr:hypothetical protein [Halogranum salarium]EJN58920.1 hypothetical protein HSB1_23410 [Halogranum salarium B-1]